MSERSRPPPSAPARVILGRLGAPHGLVGRVKVRLSPANSETLRQVERVWLVLLDGTERELGVREVRGTPAQTLLWLEGVADRDAAATLTGARLEIARGALGPLQPGEYYLADLVGARVFGPEGPVGEVVEVVANPSVDSVVIRLVDGRLAEQALSAPWLALVDAPAGRIELASTGGLIV